MMKLAVLATVALVSVANADDFVPIALCSLSFECAEDDILCELRRKDTLINIRHYPDTNRWSLMRHLGDIEMFVERQVLPGSVIYSADEMSRDNEVVGRTNLRISADGSAKLHSDTVINGKRWLSTIFGACERAKNGQ